MDLDRLERILARIEQIHQSLDDRFLEIDAALTAQRMLIEVVYANQFLANPAGLTALIAGLVERTRTSATTPEPMAADERVERQARVATRLLRFGDQVERQIASDNGS